MSLNSDSRRRHRDHDVLSGRACLTVGPFGQDGVEDGSPVRIPVIRWEPRALQMSETVVALRNRRHRLTLQISAAEKRLELRAVSMR